MVYLLQILCSGIDRPLKHKQTNIFCSLIFIKMLSIYPLFLKNMSSILPYISQFLPSMDNWTVCYPTPYKPSSLTSVHTGIVLLSYSKIQGVPLFLPPPNFLCLNGKKTVPNWPPSEMTELRIYHPQRNYPTILNHH